MKRAQDGWHLVTKMDGKKELMFSYLGRIAKHTPENDPKFQEKVDFLADALRNRLRPGKMTTKGRPYSNSVLSRWLCDVCNHFYAGRWSETDISEGHLNIVATLLGWPEVWRRGGDVMYCVDCGDFMSVNEEIEASKTDYPRRRTFIPLGR